MLNKLASGGDDSDEDGDGDDDDGHGTVNNLL